jgi:hypothetical protein
MQRLLLRACHAVNLAEYLAFWHSMKRSLR